MTTASDLAIERTFAVEIALGLTCCIFHIVASVVEWKHGNVKSIRQIAAAIVERKCQVFNPVTCCLKPPTLGEHD